MSVSVAYCSQCHDSTNKHDFAKANLNMLVKMRDDPEADLGHLGP